MLNNYYFKQDNSKEKHEIYVSCDSFFHLNNVFDSLLEIKINEHCDLYFLSYKSCSVKINILLNNPNQNVKVNLLLINNNSNQSCNVNIIHHANHTKSSFIGTCFAKNKGEIILNGNILIKKDTKQNYGELLIKGKLFSKDATISAVPQLLIDSNGCFVKHGVTIGNYDANMLLYIMSRGFSENEAKSLILQNEYNNFLPHLNDEVKKAISELFYE